MRILKNVVLAALARAGYGVHKITAHGSIATYDPAMFRPVPIDWRVVPAENKFYDPNAEGIYTLATETVIPRPQAPRERPLDFDRERERARHYAFACPQGRLPRDRYSLALRWLEPGSGLLLDACTGNPRDDVRATVASQGYRYQAIDIRPGHPEVKREDLTKLSLPTASVARILSCDTLEHIENYQAALGEMYRVLEDHGHAIVHIPCRWFDRAEGEPIKPGIDPAGHVYYHAAREFLREATNVGFVIPRVVFILDPSSLLTVLVKAPPLAI